MAHLLYRPLAKETEQIANVLIEETLAPNIRRQLRMVLGWARGKTQEEAGRAVEPRGSASTVRRAIALYRQAGLAGFACATPRRRGKAPIPEEKIHEIKTVMKERLAVGAPLTYRQYAALFTVSLGKVSRIAKAIGADRASRRGPVSPEFRGPGPSGPESASASRRDSP